MFIYKINPNSLDSHQISPAYMITAIRFDGRSSFENSDTTRKPFVIINDAITIATTSSKRSHNHSCQIHLLGGDINYSTAIAPGDFVCINMLNSTEKLFGKGGTAVSPKPDSLYARGLAGKQINFKDDGFKGLFKVQSVRRSLQVIGDGRKTLIYHISGISFSELNQVVYFNPYLSFNSGESLQNAFNLLNFNASKEWASLIAEKKDLSLSQVFKILVEFLIGKGFSKEFSPNKGDVVTNHNRTFNIPDAVTSLLGIQTPQPKAADLFRYWIGIQDFFQNANAPEIGLNPKHTINGNFFESNLSPIGKSLIQPEPWANVTAWSIINQYTNSMFNEVFTSYKLMPDNTIMPCVVFRQKPFSSPQFSEIPHTKFLSLPAWEISYDLIDSMNIGRDDSNRINFVHITTKSRYIDIQNLIAEQGALNPQQYDDVDIKKHGLRPIISGCDFDFPVDDAKTSHAPEWNKLYFDWVRDGHLKENGTVTSVGIEEPISIGDNLKLSNTIFHIESITHNMSINNSGILSFKSSFQLSYGVEYNTKQQKYPEMTYSDAFDYRVNDYKNNGPLPGFSDSQDIIGRGVSDKDESRRGQLDNLVGEELTETKDGGKFK